MTDGAIDTDRHLSRRRFLRLAGVAAAACLLPAPLAALTRRDGAVARRLELSITHTGEQAGITFARDGRYLPAALRRIAHLLRDHRTGEVHPIDPALLDLLCDLAGTLGVPPRYRVISGYRSPATNDMLRRQGHQVAKHSYHLLGRAVDVELAGVSVDDLATAARSLRRGGVGKYRGPAFVHLDTGPFRCW